MARALDDSVKEVAGTGFVTTPARWVDSLGPGSQTPVFAKDETGNVGGSHKARHLMGLLLHLAVDAVANDVRLAISSCGNAATRCCHSRSCRGPPDRRLHPDLGRSQSRHRARRARSHDPCL